MSYLKRMMNNPSCFGMARVYGAEPAAGFSPSRGVFSESGSYGARTYGAMPGAGFSPARGTFSADGHYGAPRIYGAMPGAGFSSARGTFSADGHYGAPRPTFMAQANPGPRPGFVAKPAMPSPPPPGPAVGDDAPTTPIFDGCVEISPDGSVEFNGGTLDIWDRNNYVAMSATRDINGVVHRLICHKNDPGNCVWAPLCIAAGTLKVIGKTGTPPRKPPRKPGIPSPNVIDACVEVIRNGGGAVRLTFEDGNIVEPGPSGYSLTGNTVVIDGVKHFGVRPTTMATSSQEVFVPLCVNEMSFIGPSTRPDLPPPVPGDPERPEYPPRPEKPARPEVPEFPPRPEPTGPTPTVYSPRPVPPPPTRVPPTRVPPPPTRVPPRLPPPTTGTPPERHPVPPGVYMPPPVGPTAPVPVPTGPCQPCDSYGNAVFTPVLAGYPDGKFCY